MTRPAERSSIERPADSLADVIARIRLQAELALLSMLDNGFGYADPRLPAETYLRDDAARARVHRPGLKPKGTHAEAAARVAEALAPIIESPPESESVVRLATRLNLGRAEAAVFQVVCAYELDADVRSLCHALAGRRLPRLYADLCIELGHPEVAGASDLLAVSASTSELRHLVQCDRPPHGVLSLTPLARQWLTGEAELDPVVAPCVSVKTTEQVVPVSKALQTRIDELVAHGAKHRAAIVLQGPQGCGKEAFAVHLAAKLGKTLLSTSFQALERAGGSVLLPHLITRSRIFGEALYVAGMETITDRDEVARVVAMFDAGPSTVLIGTRSPGIVRFGNRVFHHAELHRPNLPGRVAAWQRELERIGTDADATDFGRRFVVGPSDIRAACDDAKHFALVESRTPTRDDLESALGRQLSLDLGSFATQISRRALWDEMILPDDVIEPLEQMVAMVRERSRILESWGYARHLGLSRGVSALFSGSPGTGKTMAASVISGELGLELFRIDLSQVVSKWVGETEKHLARIFDEAQNAHAMLLFDEADSLFGKRTEVKSASDRYANLEVNYILQRMEQFDGVSILTTNIETALDTAFMRRLNFRVRFPDPEPAERKRLWSTLLPPEIGLEDTADVVKLAARFEMTGGHIRNAIVRAAAIAAREGRNMTAADLESGAVAEYYELGKVI